MLLKLVYSSFRGLDLIVFFLRLMKVFKLFQILKDGLLAVHVPYAYGFAIILLTVIVKVATFPLTKQQVGFFFSLWW